MKITPVLIVEEIEKSLPFWVERLGFVKMAEVPEGERLGFVILAQHGMELMLQSTESVRKDTPQFVSEGNPSGITLFIDVDDFDDVRKRLGDYPVALPERTTFYGLREIGVRGPGGHAIIFASRS
jgi:hypothetical protein